MIEIILCTGLGLIILMMLLILMYLHSLEQKLLSIKKYIREEPGYLIDYSSQCVL